MRAGGEHIEAERGAHGLGPGRRHPAPVEAGVRAAVGAGQREARRGRPARRLPLQPRADAPGAPRLGQQEVGLRGERRAAGEEGAVVERVDAREGLRVAFEARRPGRRRLPQHLAGRVQRRRRRHRGVGRQPHGHVRHERAGAERGELDPAGELAVDARREARRDGARHAPVARLGVVAQREAGLGQDVALCERGEAQAGLQRPARAQAVAARGEGRQPGLPVRGVEVAERGLAEAGREQVEARADGRRLQAERELLARSERHRRVAGGGHLGQRVAVVREVRPEGGREAGLGRRHALGAVEAGVRAVEGVVALAERVAAQAQTAADAPARRDERVAAQRRRGVRPARRVARQKGRRRIRAVRAGVRRAEGKQLGRDGRRAAVRRGPQRAQRADAHAERSVEVREGQVRAVAVGVVARPGRRAACRQDRRQHGVDRVPVAQRGVERARADGLPQRPARRDERGRLDRLAAPRPQARRVLRARAGGVDVALGRDGEAARGPLERVLGLDDAGEVRPGLGTEAGLAHRHAPDRQRAHGAQRRPDGQRLVEARAVERQRVLARLAALEREAVPKGPPADAQQRRQRRPVGARRDGRRAARQRRRLAARRRAALDALGQHLEAHVGAQALGDERRHEPVHHHGSDARHGRPQPDRGAPDRARSHGEAHGLRAVADVARQQHVRAGRHAAEREAPVGVRHRGGAAQADVRERERRARLAVDDQAGHGAGRGGLDDALRHHVGARRALRVVQPDRVGDAAEQVAGAPAGAAAPDRLLADERRRIDDAEPGRLGDGRQRRAGRHAAQNEADGGGRSRARGPGRVRGRLRPPGRSPQQAEVERRERAEQARERAH